MQLGAAAWYGCGGSGGSHSIVTCRLQSACAAKEAGAIARAFQNAAQGMRVSFLGKNRDRDALPPWQRRVWEAPPGSLLVACAAVCFTGAGSRHKDMDCTALKVCSMMTANWSSCCTCFTVVAAAVEVGRAASRLLVAAAVAAAVPRRVGAPHLVASEASLALVVVAAHQSRQVGAGDRPLQRASANGHPVGG